VPIYDLTYRGHRGVRSKLPAFFPVLENTVRLATRNKLLRSIYSSAAIPVLVAIVLLFIRYQFESGRFPGGRGAAREFLFGMSQYDSFLRVQGGLAVLLAGVIGSSAIGGDRRGNAFEAIFARPITRAQYLLGRFLGLFALAMGATLVPMFLIWLFDNIFSLDPDRLRATLHYPARFSLWATIVSGSASLLVLAVSSLVARGALAMATFGGFYFLSSAFAGVMGEVVSRGSESSARVVRAFGYGEALQGIQPAILGLPAAAGGNEISSTASFVILAALAFGSVAILFRRVKPIDVVS